ncbi:MAG TPA: ABC transporter ATP-binding protein [Jatrophihabitans sp.]|jgi:ABC-2 type transport system ATP-binding protein
MAESAIVVDNVSKRFRMYHERNQSIKAAILRRGRAKYDEFWALRDVSFEIPKGSTFGLIGENGSGKSTMLKCIARILRPNEGSIRSVGSLAALLELGSGFHPELSGRENVYLNGSILGMSKSQIDDKFDAIVDFSGIGEFIDQPVKNYSSGMYVRLGFSVAINVDPDILLVDEVLAVGDANFQDKCMEKFASFRKQGKTIVLVSHAMGSLRTLCDEAAWLDHGKLQRVGAAADIVDDYIDTGHAELETTETGATRWGSGEARITSVHLLTPDNVPVVRARTGDQVTLRINFETSEPVENPIFGFAIESREGVYVWGHNTLDSGFLPERINGVGKVDLDIPKLMLQPGPFTLLASIVDRTLTHTYDFVRDALSFEVDLGAPRESGGFIALGGEWGSLVPGSPIEREAATPS